MSLQQELAAKALAARKLKAAEDKAIADERVQKRTAQANQIVINLIGQLQTAAGGGATQHTVVISDIIGPDDPVIVYFLARMREEGLTVQEPDPCGPNGVKSYTATVSWGAGE